MLLPSRNISTISRYLRFAAAPGAASSMPSAAGHARCPSSGRVAGHGQRIAVRQAGLDQTLSISV